MKRLALAVALVAVAVSLMAASVAWGDNNDAIWATCTSGGVSATCDTTSWYAGPVSVIWQATGENTSAGPTNSSPCNLGIQYIYDADAISNLSCAATWSDGTYKADGFNLHVEASPPTASAVPSRPPDSNGWYNKPLTVSFDGSAYSGIASCTSAITYAGPNASAATFSGHCIDNAGETASVAFSRSPTTRRRPR